MICPLGRFRDTGDYTQVDLIQKNGTATKTLTCWLPAKDVEKMKAAGAEISLIGQTGAWKLGPVYGTKPKDFIAQHKMEKASFDLEEGWAW